MSVTPEDFLDFAESAVSPTATEFDLRNSASRAYYAAFHCCFEERSRTPNLTEKDIHGSHEKLYARFALLPTSTPDNLKVKQMAYVAKAMKSVRHNADYWLSCSFDIKDAKQQIRDAKRVLQYWKSLNQPAGQNASLSDNVRETSTAE